MKKLTRRQIVTIVVSAVVVIAFIIAGIVLGTKSNHENKKDTDKKVESVEKDKEEIEEDDENIKEDTEKEAETPENATQTEASSNTDNNNSQPTEPVVEKVTVYARSNVNVRSGAGTSNSKIGSLTKGQEVTKVGEENGWSKIEFNGTVGYVSSKYLSAEKVSVSTTNSNEGNTGSTTATTPSTSTPQPSPYAGMYSLGDEASLERLAKCAEILKGGLGSQYLPCRYHVEEIEMWGCDYMCSSLTYWGDELMLCSPSTSGAWVYICISGWSGMGIGAETEPIYGEIPSLMKQCLEAIAPQGGTELYNKVNSLILQYGSPYSVPTQGTIEESIPGLSVALEDGKSGLYIYFYAE